MVKALEGVSKSCPSRQRQAHEISDLSNHFVDLKEDFDTGPPPPPLFAFQLEEQTVLAAGCEMRHVDKCLCEKWR